MKLLKHLAIAFATTALIWSCDNSSNQPRSNEFREIPQTQPAQQPTQQAAPGQAPGQVSTPSSGQVDQYGRQPGSAHYGHDHPLLPEEQNNQNLQNNPMIQQQPAAGQKDKYGRSPGDAHYGHDHPLQDDEKQVPLQTSPLRVQ